MPGLELTGFEPATLADIREEINDSLRAAFGSQWASWRTCSGVTFSPSQWRSTASPMPCVRALLMASCMACAQA